MRRFIPLAIVLTLFAGLIAAAWFFGAGHGWDHNTAHVVHVVNDQGQPISDGNTVIIDRDRGPFFFFPFGLFLIPLFFFALFWAFGRAAWRGGRPYGPNGFNAETPPPWFEQWYRQMQRRDAGAPQPPQDE